jgi:hypothetical protein
LTFDKKDREKNKAILIAVLNYLLEYHSDDMVFDDFSPSKNWYLSDLRQTELDIIKSRSNNIKRRLDKHIGLLRNRYDLRINNYVNENTGYEIDIYEEYKTQILSIILKGHIADNDTYPAERYLKAYRADPQEHERINLLKVLLKEREVKLIGATDPDGSSNHEVIFISVGNSNVNDKNWLLYDTMSPDGNNKLSVQFNGKGITSITYVDISLKGGTGAICTFQGEKLPIKAYWKSDSHIIIEHEKEYTVMSKYNVVSSYGEKVIIEYQYAK